MKADTTQLWNAAIEPFVAFSQKVIGYREEVRRVVEPVIRAKLTRQQIHHWLATDPTKRVEPRAGMGLALLDACAKVKAGWTKRTVRKAR